MLLMDCSPVGLWVLLIAGWRPHSVDKASVELKEDSRISGVEDEREADQSLERAGAYFSACGR
jgi:hypothetical protein